MVVAPVSHQRAVTRDARPGPRRNWRRTPRWDWVSTALTLIILGGAVVRLVGGSWGLPLELHPDEWVIFDGAIDMAKRHSFELPYYFRPDHVEMQLSNLAYLAYSYLFQDRKSTRLNSSHANIS